MIEFSAQSLHFMLDRDTSLIVTTIAALLIMRWFWPRA
jgi:hypothetical protein